LGKGAAIDDVFTSESTDDKPISCGIFVQKKSDEPFSYTYKYDEVKIIIEGNIHLQDGPDGEIYEAKKGDVLSIKKGTTVIFTSPDEGKAFYVGQRAFRDF